MVQIRDGSTSDAAFACECAITSIANEQAMVFGSFAGLLNLVIFLLLVTLIASLVAVQLLRGDIPQGDTMTFSQTYNSFLAMYQVGHSIPTRDIPDIRSFLQRIGRMCSSVPYVLISEDGSVLTARCPDRSDGGRSGLLLSFFVAGFCSHSVSSARLGFLCWH